MKTRHAFLAGLILAMACCVAWPNSAPIVYQGIGGADVRPIRNDKIRMVREVVDIDCNWRFYTVRVDFWFKNTSQQKQELQLGFPVDYSKRIVEIDEDNETIKNSLMSFNVSWNGKPVRFATGKRQPILIKDGDNYIESYEYRQWVTWQVCFAPNEEVHSRVSYTFPGWTSDGGSKDSPYVYLKYILRTGAAWQGAIESSTVIIHYGHKLSYCGIGENDEEVPEPSSLRFYPKGCVIDQKKKTVTWQFRNFVPDKDIYFGWGDVPDFELCDRDERVNISEPVPNTMLPASARSLAK